MEIGFLRLVLSELLLYNKTEFVSDLKSGVTSAKHSNYLPEIYMCIMFERTYTEYEMHRSLTDFNVSKMGFCKTHF